MLIGELAHVAGISRDTVRFYESKGLLISRRGTNGYRHYAPASADFVRYIKTAQRLGFSLGEIARHMRQANEAADPDAAVAELLRDRVAAIEQRIVELGQLRDELHARLDQTCPMRT